VAAKAEHDRSKLPKWAQREIERQERDIAYLQGKLAAGPENSDTFADPYSEGAMRPLGRGTTVEFRINPQSKIRCRVMNTHRGPVLDVNGDVGIYIEPTASNAIRIRA